MRDPARRGIKSSFEDSDFLLEFNNSTEDFRKGFECGEIWACLSDGVDYVRSIISSDNTEMIMRMVDAVNTKLHENYLFEGFEVPTAAIDTLELGPGDWIIVTIRKADYDG